VLLSKLPTNQIYTINYYRNKADALAEINFITDISNYRNIGYPNSQDIWVRIESKLDNACVGLGPYITLNVDALPIANSVLIPRQCDDNQDGIFNFDTSTLESTLLNGQTNVTVTYFDQNNSPLKDTNGITITSPFPSNFKTKSQTIKAVVTNNSTLKCFDETLITFTVDDLPEAFTIPLALTSTCDDEPDPLNQDGNFAFDTSLIQATILGTQSGLLVNYYDQNGNPLPSPLPNPFITGTQDVTATVINPLNLSCTANTTIHFVVNPIPKINLNTNGGENELVCSNIPTFFVTLNSGIQDGSSTSNYTYIWSKDGNVIPAETNYNLNVNSNGDYLVKVTTAAGCYRTRNINVTASDIATINSIDITDLSDANSVTVNVSGKGNYEFSLDAPLGPFQTSNLFENVSAGIHDVYVTDTNGCGTITEKIGVLGVPKFFTPNGDGYNDYWNVKGVNTTLNSKSTIYIFDRYGKLMKQLLPSSQGWDGTINGSPLPADDYWYSVQLEDGRELKGHFSLKR
jgi:gliding motility-associated-like protein